MRNKEYILQELNTVFGEAYVDLQAHRFIIHFPLLDIQDGEGNEQELHDLFVSIGVEFNLDDAVTGFGTSMQGMRTTFTQEQAINLYSHSHLTELYEDEDNGNYTTEFRDFCLGDDTLQQTLQELQMEFNEDKFTILLYTIDEFVRWESVEGGPYMSIGELRKWGSTYIEIGSHETTYSGDIILIADDFMNFVSKELLESLSYVTDKTITSFIDNLLLQESIYEFSLNNTYIIEKVLYVEGKYYKKNPETSDYTHRIDEENWRGDIVFKGNTYYANIVAENIEEEEEKDAYVEANGVRTFHPHLKNQLLVEVQKRLHTFLTDPDKWKLNLVATPQL